MEIDIDFKPILEQYLETMREKFGSEDEIRLWIRTPKGQRDFEKYCDACIKLQASEQLKNEV